MKRFFIILGAVAFSLWNVCAQIVITSGSMSSGTQKPPKTLDDMMLQITYEVRSVRDSLKPDQSVEDVMVLQIGKQGISKYYNDSNRRRDSMILAMNPQLASPGAGGSVTIRADAQSLQSQGIRQGSGDQTTIFKNWPAGNITVTDRVMMNQYSYTEPANQMEWQILPETDTILSYFCQKAVTEFRGRRYEAWFTPEIPLYEGPWKFGGLPGLILKVSDTRNHYSFQCTGLIQADGPVAFADVDYIKTNRKDFSKVKRKFYEDPMGSIEAMNSSIGDGRQVSVQVRNRDGTPVTQGGRPMSMPYNPIELDL